MGGLFSTQEVTDLFCLLECVAGVNAKNALIRVLLGPRFALGVRDLAALSQVARWFAQRDATLQPLSEEDQKDDEVLPDPDRIVTNLDALEAVRNLPDTHRALKPLSDSGKHTVREAAQMLHRLRQLNGGKISDLLKACEQELRLDIELATHPQRSDTSGTGNSEANTVDPRANIDAFVEAVEAAEKHSVGRGLVGVLDWLRRAVEADEFDAATPEPAPDTVQILTVHKAKGLEWDIVALPGMSETKFPGVDKDSNGWIARAKLPDELRGDRASRPEFLWRVSRTQQEVLEAFRSYKTEKKQCYELEERRLAYVALTRSKHSLWMSGSFWHSECGGR